MRGLTRSLIAFLLTLGLATSATAADTGTVSGTVFDAAGQPVADAAVSLSGDLLPVARRAQTGANGTYQFQYLLPGAYAVEIEKAGVGRARRDVVVEIGRDTQADLVLGLLVSEELTVTAARPIVDVKSSEVSFNYTADTLASLPIERTYRGLFQLIPGVADNRSPVGPAAGGGRQDNTYLIDGANITSPGYGYLSGEVNELDVAEVNLKRAGISAEFGRTAGSVTNAVSRSGSNEFAGVARIDWLSQNLVSGYELPDDLAAAGVRPGTFRDPLLTSEIGPTVGVGGPILADRAFFYASARYFNQVKWDRANKLGTPLPDEERTGHELFGKITATPTPGNQLTVSYRHRPNHLDNAGLSSDTAPTVASLSDNGGGIGTAEWSNFTVPRSAINVRYLYLKETNEDVPVRSLGYLPPFDPTNLSAMGQYNDPAQANLTVGASQYSNIQNYRRHELRGTFNRLVDVGRTSHTLKVGAGYEFAEEKLDRLANGWGLISNVTVNDVPAIRTRYFTPQAPQYGVGQTYSIFLQDDVSLGRRTQVTAGVLLNRDDFSQRLKDSRGCPTNVPLKGGAALYQSSGDTCAFLRFGFADEIQPRIGVSRELRAGKGDKVYGNWGRYYNMDQKSTARSLAPSRIYQTQTIFDLQGKMLSSGPLASTTGKLIDPAIRPIYTDEYLVGYATPFPGISSLDVFFMSRRMNNFIEDVPSRRNGTAPDSGPFVATNLPCTAFAACQLADAQRTYKAVTVNVRRRVAERWLNDASYTWSRFVGNFDIDYATVGVFNTSSFIQDGPGTNVEDPNRYGPLFEDRPHVFKWFSSYAVMTNVSVSGYLRVQSGAPWAARARDWEGGAVLNYLEPAGSHRNPAWTNLDLMASYRLPMARTSTLSLEARLLNVFDTQTRLSTDSQQYLDLRTIPNPPYFAPYQQPNPFFGTGNAFAPPRRLFLSAVATF
jgi:carboxypeptidase family protein